MFPKLDTTELAEGISYKRVTIKNIKIIYNGYLVTFEGESLHHSLDYYVKVENVQEIVDLDMNNKLCFDLTERRLCAMK